MIKYIKLNSSKAFDKAKSGSAGDKLKYLNSMWKKLNKEKFGNKLKPATLYIQKHRTAESNRGHGVWYIKKRRLGINPRIFNSNEEQFIKLLLHEMCHQAVTDIEETVDGHGMVWQRWMIKVGLKPDRYANKEDHENLLTEDEKKAKKKKLVKEDNLAEGLTISRVLRKGGCHKAIFDGKLEIGRIAFQKQGGRIVFLTPDEYITLPNKVTFYDCTKKEETKLKKQVTDNDIETVIEDYKSKILDQRLNRKVKKGYEKWKRDKNK